MHEAALDWATDTVVAAVGERRFSSDAALYLLHAFVRTGRPDVLAAAEQALTEGLARTPAETDPFTQLEWLGVFRHAGAFSADERLHQATTTLLPGAVDGLERAVRVVYEPGEGLLGGSVRDHLRCASALVTGFELTGRLPYPMLAEELLQTVRRRAWSDATQTFSDSFRTNALAASVWCRVAALHADEEYASRAVLAPEAGYVAEAGAMLRWAGAHYRNHPNDAAVFGLAVVHGLALHALPN